MIFINIDSLTTLLIEDSPADSHYIQMLLRKHQEVEWKFVEAQNIHEAIEQLNHHSFDLIISDLMLPDYQGIETFEKIKSYTEQIPCIVLTGIEDEQLGIHAVQMGAQDYLIKNNLDERLLFRSIFYAITRHKLRKKLHELKYLEKQQEEFQHLTELAKAKDSTEPLKKRNQPLYFQCVSMLEKVLKNALERHFYKEAAGLKSHLVELADLLGKNSAEPRDVIEIHCTALKNQLSEVKQSEAIAINEEARLILVEIMGYLTLYYRNTVRI